MEKDVATDLSGHLRKFFIALIAGTRDETGMASSIEVDLNAIYQAGEGKWGTEDSVFIQIMASRSFGFLA